MHCKLKKKKKRKLKFPGATSYIIERTEKSKNKYKLQILIVCAKGKIDNKAIKYKACIFSDSLYFLLPFPMKMKFCPPYFKLTTLFIIDKEGCKFENIFLSLKMSLPRNAVFGF